MTKAELIKLLENVDDNTKLEFAINFNGEEDKDFDKFEDSVSAHKFNHLHGKNGKLVKIFLDSDDRAAN